MSEGRFRRLVVVAGIVGTLHALAYTPVVAHETNDSEAYIAAASAILDGRYSTPLRAASLYETSDAVADLTAYELPPETWDALEAHAFRPPGYPLLLAAVGGGGGGASQLLLLVVQSVLLGAAVVVLGMVARELFGPGVGAVAAWAYALDPYSRHHASLVLTEALAAFLVVIGVWAFVRAWRSGSPRLYAAAAAAAAVLTLTRPIFLLATVLVALGALVARGSGRERIVRALTATAVAAALLAPWLAWTAATTGRPVLTTLSRGTGLLYAAHGEGPGRAYGEIVNDPEFIADLTAPHRYAPSAAELLRDREAHPRYVRLADEEYGRLATERYRRRLADEPAAVASEYAYRAYALWQARFDWPQLADRAPVPAAVLDGVVLLLALVGTAAAAARGGVARPLAALLVVYTAASALFHVEARYGMPLRGLLLVFAVVGAASVARAGARVAAR